MREKETRDETAEISLRFIIKTKDSDDFGSAIFIELMKKKFREKEKKTEN